MDVCVNSWEFCRLIDIQIRMEEFTKKQTRAAFKDKLNTSNETTLS